MFLKIYIPPKCVHPKQSKAPRSHPSLYPHLINNIQFEPKLIQMIRNCLLFRMAGRNNSRTVLSCVPFIFTFSSPNPAMSMPSCMVKVCVNSGVLVFFLARMLSMLVYLFETKSSYQDAISKGFLGISLLPSRHTEPKVGVLSSDSDVERMRGHSSDHPIMPIS